MTNRYKQLTYEQRCQISVLNNSGFSQREIAELVMTSQSTISRELKRNKGNRGYRHKQAQDKACQRRQEGAKATVMTKAVIHLIETKIRLEWSPKQVSGWLLKEKFQRVSHESIYLHIWQDKKSGGELYTYLRRRRFSS